MGVARFGAQGDISPRRFSRTVAQGIMSEENGYVNDLDTGDADPTVDAVAADGVAADVAPSGTDRQLADERDRFLRLAAEYDNFRKRTTKERQEAHLRGQADLLKGMIDALDDLARFAHV